MARLKIHAGIEFSVVMCGEPGEIYHISDNRTDTGPAPLRDLDTAMLPSPSQALPERSAPPASAGWRSPRRWLLPVLLLALVAAPALSQQMTPPQSLWGDVDLVEPAGLAWGSGEILAALLAGLLALLSAVAWSALRSARLLGTWRSPEDAVEAGAMAELAGRGRWILAPSAFLATPALTLAAMVAGRHRMLFGVGLPSVALTLALVILGLAILAYALRGALEAELARHVARRGF
ncbi:MAG: hypothetical protein AAGN66_25580 [Acidobacteriota bacterium]